MTQEQRGANELKYLNDVTTHTTNDINDIVGSIWTDSDGHLLWINEICHNTSGRSNEWIATGTITDCPCARLKYRHNDLEHEVGGTTDEFLGGRMHGWLRLSAAEEQIYHLQPGQEVRIVITGIVEDPKHYGNPGEYPAVVVVSGDTNGDRTVLRFTGKNDQAGPTLRGVESVLPTYQIQELP